MRSIPACRWIQNYVSHIELGEANNIFTSPLMKFNEIDWECQLQLSNISGFGLLQLHLE